MTWLDDESTLLVGGGKYHEETHDEIEIDINGHPYTILMPCSSHGVPTMVEVIEDLIEQDGDPNGDYTAARRVQQEWAAR